ncbi:regulator of microtubule dynamics protein 1-like [Ochlerotatus camptorhynchus]|uniref:regulator of microtubule dynamics protein 1-like n=1 Tax=Ochlerotatus camptorhynchus TaxID=644619 RepID=UPI0031E075A3
MSDLDEVIYKADQFIENCEFEEACNLLRQHMSPPKYEVLRRLANSLYSLVREWYRTDKKRADKLILEGYDISSKLLEVSPNASPSHKYYAIFLGEKAGISGPKQQIMSLVNVLSHIKTANQLDPLDPFVWYLEGGFYEKLLCLHWFEKKFVYTLNKELVRPTYDDALRCLLKAEEIKPNFFYYNQYLIGKIYFDQKEFDTAKPYLLKLANLRILRTDDDKRAKEEAEKMLANM